MKRENNILVLESKEDKDLLFDMCDNYVEWFNYQGDDEVNDKLFDDYKKSLDKIRNEISNYFPYKIEDILNAFADREECFVSLWDKILKCLILADLVKINFDKKNK